MRVMNVSRPGSLSGLSRAASAIASSAVVVGPSLTPIGLRMWRSSSTWAPSSWRVRSPIQTKWPDTSYGSSVRRVDAGHRVLVLEHQRLVAGVEVDAVELVGVGADRLHEGQRPVDLAGQLLVALADRRLADEVGVPGVHLAQVGVAAGDEGADQVQRRGGGVVDLDQPLRVGHPGLGGEVEAVDRVAAVGRQGDAVAGLEVGGARLGVLAGEPADLHDRHGRGVGQHDRHLQQHPQLVADVVGGDARRRSRRSRRPGAGTPRRGRPRRSWPCSSSHSPAKTSGGMRAQPGDGGVDGAAVGVRRLLGGPEGVQGREVGDAHRQGYAGDARVPDPAPQPGHSGRRPRPLAVSRRRPRPRRTPRG